jgi:uncharacterized UPF0146 family protein
VFELLERTRKQDMGFCYSRRTTINLGIGHRLLVEDDMAIVGINVFTDYETKSRHRRLSLGLEYQRTNFSANINKYHMLSGPLMLTSLRPAPNAFKNLLALSLSKPSVLLMAWFLS